MKWLVEGKDWQQQGVLVLSHGREDTKVRSICKNLRLLKVKLTTNPPLNTFAQATAPGYSALQYSQSPCSTVASLAFHDSYLSTKPP